MGGLDDRLARLPLNAIFEYIDTWYNTRRIQKELGYLSPDEYETAWHTQTEPDNLTPAPTGSR